MKRKEEFIDIAGYDGLYQIGTHGTVISLEREKQGRGSGTYYTHERILLQHKNRFGYVSVNLCDDYGTKKKIDVHRLVALNHIPNPENKPQVNHIDGNKSNNHIDNLEWCTQAENMAHASAMGLMARGERHDKAIFTKDQVIKMKRLMKYNVLTNTQMAEVFETSRVNISRIKNGSRWQHIKI